MNYFGRIISNISQVYSEINPATLTGAIDVIIVEQEDGTFSCSPFHVRFGKIGVLRSREKIVDIEINGEPIDIHMKLGDSGEAYFVEEVDSNDEDAGEADFDQNLYRSTDSGENSANTSASSHSKASDCESEALKPFNSLSFSSSLPLPTKCDLPKSLEHHFDSLSIRNGQLDVPPDNDEQHLTVKTICDTVTFDNGGDDNKDRIFKRVKRKKKNTRNKLSTNRSSEGNLELFATGNGSSMTKVIDGHKNISGISNQNLLQSNIVNESVSGQNFTEDEIHPFSDSEISVFTASQAKMQRKESENDCKSDSEYEMYKSNPEKQCHRDNQDTISWNWGELPQNVEKDQHLDSSISGQSVLSANSDEMSRKSDKENEKDKHSKMFGMLGLFKSTKPSLTQTDNEDKGIYLDSLDPNELNPEVAAKYFPNIGQRSSFSSPKSEVDLDDDVESGTGPSLSASPQSVSEFNFNSANRNEDDDLFHFDKTSTKYHDFSMSLCGRVEDLQAGSEESHIFLQSLVRYEEFIQKPEKILNDSNLVIRFGGKFYSWKMASAILISYLAFQRELPQSTIDTLKPPKKLPTPQNQASSGWTSWFRSNHKDVQKLKTTISAEHSYAKPVPGSDIEAVPRPKVSKPTALEYTSDDETINIMLKKTDDSTSDTSSSTKQTPGNEEKKQKVKFRKVLTLKSDVIRSLNLKPNCNEVSFSVTTAFQGTTVSKSKIFLWRFSDKIIISDIDGTITRSDVLGHVLPYFGKDWAQAGVTQLFTNIESNGYKFLYLSARAIGQAKTTRDYLRDLKQEDVGLPDGPLLLSPTSLISALHREVIERRPEEFKIACLKNIQTLFPNNPFFAGFGNKVNDNWAYKAVGIDQNRIFTINPKGELKLERLMSFKSSYADLSQFADQMFPPIDSDSSTKFSQNSENTNFSDFMFWRSEILEPSEDDIRKISVISS